MTRLLDRVAIILLLLVVVSTVFFKPATNSLGPGPSSSSTGETANYHLVWWYQGEKLHDLYATKAKAEAEFKGWEFLTAPARGDKPTEELSIDGGLGIQVLGVSSAPPSGLEGRIKCYSGDARKPLIEGGASVEKPDAYLESWGAQFAPAAGTAALLGLEAGRVYDVQVFNAGEHCQRVLPLR